jgi:hypothetical protein
MSCVPFFFLSMVPFGKRPEKLPAVLGGEEVANLLSCVSNIKHRTFLLTLYAAGLRLNEGRTSDGRLPMRAATRLRRSKRMPLFLWDSLGG